MSFNELYECMYNVHKSHDDRIDVLDKLFAVYSCNEKYRKKIYAMLYSFLILYDPIATGTLDEYLSVSRRHDAWKESGSFGKEPRTLYSCVIMYFYKITQLYPNESLEQLCTWLAEPECGSRAERVLLCNEHMVTGKACTRRSYAFIDKDYLHHFLDLDGNEIPKDYRHDEYYNESGKLHKKYFDVQGNCLLQLKYG